MKDIEEVTPPGAPKQTTRLEVLLDNYRESRTEGMELARSVFTDILIIAGFLGAIIGGELLTDNPRILFFSRLYCSLLLFTPSKSLKYRAWSQAT